VIARVPPYATGDAEDGALGRGLKSALLVNTGVLAVPCSSSPPQTFHPGGGRGRHRGRPAGPAGGGAARRRGPPIPMTVTSPAMGVGEIQTITGG